MENQERLAIVETELRQLNKMMSSMNEKLDVWNQNYVPRNEIDERFRSRDKEIAALRHDFTITEENKWSIRRMWPAWLGVLVGVLSIIKDLL